MTKNLFPPLILSAALLLNGCTTSRPSNQPSPIKDEPPAKLNTQARPNQKTTHSSSLTPEILYDLLVANLGYQRGENQLATSALSHAAGLSNDPKLIAQAARTALHYKQYASATELGTLWMQLQPGNNASFIITALAQIKQGKTNQAFDVLANLIKQRPETVISVYQQISAVIQQHAATTETMELVSSLVKLQPKQPTAWLMQAALAETLKDEPHLIEAIDALLAIDPSDETAAVYKLISLEQQSPEQLASFMKAYLELKPDAIPARMQYARSLLRLGQDQAALNQYADVLEVNPEYSDALYAAGLVHHGRSEFKLAAGFLRGRVETSPKDERARLYLGTALRELKHYDESIAMLESIRTSQHRFSALRQIAISIEEKTGTTAALQYLEQLHPGNNDESVQLLLDQSQILRRDKQFIRAKNLLDAGLQGFPDQTDIIHHRALLAAEMDDIELHESDMRRLIELEPEDANHYNTLGYTLLEKTNRFDTARTLIEKAMSIKPDDPFITDSLGWLAFKSGDLDKAIQLLEKAFELDRDAEIAAHLGEVYWVLGQQDKAQAIWETGQQLDSENKALLETLNRLTQ